MKKLITLLVCSLYFIYLKASPQAPDFLIIGKDTIPIYFLPLEKLDSTKHKELFNHLNERSFALNLYRGYQALWKLEDNKLYLTELKGFPNSENILKSVFASNYENGKVLANWFSSYLAIAKDKILKWDGVFSRTYFKEEILEFKSGLLIDRKMVNNYTHLRNGISRLNKKLVTDTIFYKINQLNWKKISRCDCDTKYELTINQNGKIDKITLVSIYDTKKENDEDIMEHKRCIKAFKKQLKDLQFDIIRWNGKPYQERIFFEVFYTVDNKLENWTNH